MLTVTSIGVPLPATLFLLALGSFVAQGDLDLWPVLAIATVAAVAGDHLGYCIGRVGGRRAVDAIVRRTGRGVLMRRAEEFTARWGAPGIFLSRWLVGGLGPWINLSSGVARYPWRRFLFWDVLGEVVWVGLYVMLGRAFSNRVQDLADLVGSVGWLVVAVLIAAISGWALVREFRRAARRMRDRRA